MQPIGCRCHAFARRLFAIFSVVLCLGALRTAHASELFDNTITFLDGRIVLENPVSRCTGTCGVHVFAGSFLETDMTEVFGLEGYVAPWNWTYGTSNIAGGAVSRRLATVFQSVDLEAELGLGQRFGGGAHATEAWGAFYLRWHRFPWNRYLHTTVAVSTGLSYASRIDDIEVERSPSATSRLLHYFSPEITFARPDHQHVKLVLRLHHRSGGRDYVFGDTEIFNGVSGGAQYLTAGLKYQF